MSIAHGAEGGGGVGREGGVPRRQGTPPPPPPGHGLLLPARGWALRRHDVIGVAGVYLGRKLPQEAFCQNSSIKVVAGSLANSFIYLGDKGSGAES